MMKPHELTTLQRLAKDSGLTVIDGGRSFIVCRASMRLFYGQFVGCRAFLLGYREGATS